MKQAGITDSIEPLSSGRKSFDLMSPSFLRNYFGKAITATQVLLDFVTVFSCYMGAYWLYTIPLDRAAPQSFSEFLGISSVAGILYVLILDKVGLYRREISLLNIKELRGIFHVGIYAAAAVLSVSFYVRSTSLSRIILTVAILATPIALYIQRQFFYKLHVLFHSLGWSKTRVLVFGAGSIGSHLCRRFFESPALGLLPIGFLDDDPSKHGQTLRWNRIGPKAGLPILGGEEMIARLVKELDVGLVVIALPNATFERNQKLVDICHEIGIEYAIVPNSYEKFVQQVEWFEIGGIPVLRRHIRHTSIYYLAVKRFLDFMISGALMVALSPLVFLLGLAIRLDSRGPIIFKQKRVGLLGREFSFYKFRSMYLDAPRYARTPTDAADPRITRVGRWLRRTSLDELPQLFNVFRGDMSLVGPRPEMPFIVAEYSQLERQRLEAKPGITGVWQISAVRGEEIHKNLEYDLFYLENRSVLLDFAILIKTALSVIRGIGAV
ncbi:sugar transferase [bacterium]|nr:sugar transferase [bacterium]